MGFLMPSDRVKFAIYLREVVIEAASLLLSRKRGLSFNVSEVISDYLRICRQNSGLIAQARLILAKEYPGVVPVTKIPRTSVKIQVYTSQEEAAFLEDFAQKKTKGNISLAVNQILLEYLIVVLTHPKITEQKHDYPERFSVNLRK
jgi:hypothetical protein